MTDGRSATARRFRDLYQDIATDLCGIDQLSEGQKQLARRAAMLSAESERMEALGVPRDGERGALVWFLRGETVRALGPEHATTDGGRDFLKEVQGGYRLPMPIEIYGASPMHRRIVKLTRNFDVSK